MTYLAISILAAALPFAGAGAQDFYLRRALQGLEAGDPPAPSCDEHWDDVVLLMHMDGASLGTDFPDATGRHSPIYGGDPYTSQASPRFGTAAAFFDGLGDRIEVADSPDWVFGSGDFTIEMWVKTFAYSPHVFISQGRTEATHFNSTFKAGYNLGKDADSRTTLYVSDALSTHNDEDNLPGNWDFAASTPAGADLDDNVWRHFAFVRAGNQIKVFIEGQELASRTLTAGFTLIDSTEPLRIGAVSNDTGDGTEQFHFGLIDELRVTRGVARYTASFEVPPGPFAEEACAP